MNEPINYSDLYFSTATQRLKLFCYSLIACSGICIFLFFLILANVSAKYAGFAIMLFVLVILTDIWLASLTLSLVKDAGSNREPAVKKQFVYLLVLYLSIFSVILHFTSIYILFRDFKSIYFIMSFIGVWQQLCLFVFIIVTVLSSVLLPVVQVKSFKFIKLLRHADVQIGAKE